MNDEGWPPLSLAAWEPTYLTLHRWLQVVGKVRMALEPRENHWWHVPLYVTPRGLTTSTMPYAGGALVIDVDFIAHELAVKTSLGRSAAFRLEPMPVAEFMRALMSTLGALDVDVEIWPVPVEVVDRTPLDEDTKHAAYDLEAIERIRRILVSTTVAFSRFRSGFIGKSSPVHFFWGAFDLALTRFSGRRNPNPPADPVMGPAYSHEVISHGFWPGGDWPGAGRVEEAVFYAYAVPEPPGFATATLNVPGASYDQRLHEFVIPYDTIRRAPDPNQALLDFMQATYDAGAKAGGWPVDELAAELPPRRPPPAPEESLPSPPA